MRCLICHILPATRSRTPGAVTATPGQEKAYGDLELEVISWPALLAAARDMGDNPLLPMIIATSPDAPVSTTEMVKRIRELRNIGCAAPLLVAVGHDLPEGTAALLDAGADDAVLRLDLPREIPARLGAITRRLHRIATGEVRVGALTFNLDGSAPEVNANPLRLSAREHDILRHLALNQGRIVAKSTLYDALYALAPMPPFDKIIEVYICRLRAKLKEAQPEGGPVIETIKGRGYRLTEAPPLAVT